MSNYKPMEGDRVRVVLEGTVTCVSGNGVNFELDDDAFVEPSIGYVISVEKLTDPEPPHRSVVLDKAGDAWQRSGSRWNFESERFNWDELNADWGPLRIIHRAEED